MADSEIAKTNNAAGGITQIPGVRQLVTLVAIAASVAIGVVVVLWSQEPSYRPLRGVPDLAKRDVMTALDSMNIRYRMDSGTGVLMVPSDAYQQIVANLQGDQLIGGGQLDLNGIYSEKTFGTSQFEEIARHQIALQNDIAETIMRIRVVQNAKVMLALPERSAFLRDKKKPEASVTVVVRPGSVLEAHQVQGIVHTVSAAVPGLETKSVTVMNQYGELLTTPNMTSEMAQTSTQFEYQQKMQNALSRQIESFLTPIMGGPGRVRAVVSAEIDFTQSEQTLESFDPSQDKIRSEEGERTVNSSPESALGPPGALTNQPPETGQPPAEDEQGDSGVTSRDYRKRNYELDKETRYTKNATGSITRLSIALLIDHKPTTGEDGETTHVPLTDEELQEVTELAKNAVGFDEARGDTLFVSNQAFVVPPPMEPPEPTPIWKQAWVMDIGKQVLSAIVLLGLGFGLLKPLLNRLTEPGQWQSLPAAGGVTSVKADDLPANAPYQEPDPLQLAKNLTQQDPKRVAQVVKDWVADE